MRISASVAHCHGSTIIPGVAILVIDLWYYAQQAPQTRFVRYVTAMDAVLPRPQRPKNVVSEILTYGIATATHTTRYAENPASDRLAGTLYAMDISSSNGAGW